MSTLEMGKPYDAQAIACGLGEAQTGTPQIAITYQLFDGDDVIGEAPYYGFLTDAAMEYAIKTCRTSGWEGNDISELDDCNCAEKLPNRIQVVLEENEWEGEVSVRVKWVNAGGGVRLKKRLDPAGKARLADRIKARIMLMEKQGGKPAASRQAPPKRLQATGTDDLPPEAVGPDDDDIPFS
jgi:hypothetical protein